MVPFGEGGLDVFVGHGNKEYMGIQYEYNMYIHIMQ